MLGNKFKEKNIELLKKIISNHLLMIIIHFGVFINFHKKEFISANGIFQRIVKLLTNPNIEKQKIIQNRNRYKQ